MVDEILLLAATRHQNLDLAAALDRERLCEQGTIRNVMRDEHAARRRLVVVELREKRAEHLAGAERSVGLGKIRAVAPVLAGAEEEHLDAVEPAVLVRREHVRLLDAARVDALMRL